MKENLAETRGLGGEHNWPKKWSGARRAGPTGSSTRPQVIKLEFILRLKIKRNDWLLADSQSLRLILSLRLYSGFITSRPGPCLRHSEYLPYNLQTKENKSSGSLLLWH